MQNIHFGVQPSECLNVEGFFAYDRFQLVGITATAVSVADNPDRRFSAIQTSVLAAFLPQKATAKSTEFCEPRPFEIACTMLSPERNLSMRAPSKAIHYLQTNLTAGKIGHSLLNKTVTYLSRVGLPYGFGKPPSYMFKEAVELSRNS